MPDLLLTLSTMVAGPGIAPGTGAYETPEILLLQPAINLAALGGNDPHSSTVTVSCASMNTLRPNLLVPQEGIEPPHPAYKAGPLPLRIQGQNWSR